VRPAKAVAMVVGVGSLGAAVLLRRRAAAHRERVEMYLADGNKLTLDEAAPEQARLVGLARDVLRAAS
jgi:hypothetical protein